MISLHMENLWNVTLKIVQENSRKPIDCDFIATKVIIILTLLEFGLVLKYI